MLRLSSTLIGMHDEFGRNTKGISASQHHNVQDIINILTLLIIPASNKELDYTTLPPYITRSAVNALLDLLLPVALLFEGLSECQRHYLYDIATNDQPLHYCHRLSRTARGTKKCHGYVMLVALPRDSYDPDKVLQIQ
jgi:hypothetical protein